MNILVAPATTGIGIEVIRSLSFAKNIDIFGCGFDSVRGQTLQIRKFIHLDLHASPKKLVDELNNIVQKFDIDLVFVCHDQWLRDLKNEMLPKELKCKIINLPNSKSVMALSKKSTFEHLREHPMTPITYKDINEVVDFPVFLKPDEGQGSRGARVIKKIEDFSDEEKKGFDRQFVVTEFLPGEELTVDCFSDPLNTLIYCNPRVRKVVSGGISTETFPYVHQGIESLATYLSKEFEMNGPWFFQLKQSHKGEWKLLEIGLRIAGASGINRCMGTNFALMHIYQHLGYTLESIRQLLELTYFQKDNICVYEFKPTNAYFDFDDTIIGERGINQRIINAIEKLYSQHVVIQILTRSTANIGKRLNDIGLLDRISKIVYLTQSEKKSSYIDAGQNFLFVDDSYRERSDVLKNHGSRGIVLDPSAFETELVFNSSIL